MRTAAFRRRLTGAAPNRNHGIFGGNTRRHLFKLITRYLDEHLAAQESPALTF